MALSVIEYDPSLTPGGVGYLQMAAKHGNHLALNITDFFAIAITGLCGNGTASVSRSVPVHYALTGDENTRQNLFACNKKIEGLSPTRSGAYLNRNVSSLAEFEVGEIKFRRE